MILNAPSAPLIELQAVCKDYLMDGSLVVPALKSIDLTIEHGEFVAVMGPSGSGKSTLLNILGTLDQPTSGSYRLCGIAVDGLYGHALADFRLSTIGFVFQGFNLLQSRSVLDNVALPLIYAGDDHGTRSSKASLILERVGLPNRRHHFPSQLSGGQQQRVAIARALVNSPKLILADEPTGNLDTATGKEIMALLTALNEGGITIILVTHDHDVASYAERLVHCKDGEIVYDGPMY